ncbi:MAG: hypothetical protein KF912_05255 [Phycisphaeraceae bacterium]|nr:hypothetical protein [Phycisphaeraceae bacterium]MBX3366707.1 hypothetical protein [Phycisphaeraceae bacterium]
MDIPRWSDMDQKQRIMSIGGGVLLLIAIVLIARGLFGGGAAEPVDPAAVQGLGTAVQDGTIKLQPPNPENEESPDAPPAKRPVGGGTDDE